jgi:hypothetical protein
VLQGADSHVDVFLLCAAMLQQAKSSSSKQHTAAKDKMDCNEREAAAEHSNIAAEQRHTEADQRQRWRR